MRLGVAGGRGGLSGRLIGFQGIGVGRRFGVDPEVPEIKIHPFLFRHFDKGIFAGREIFRGREFQPAAADAVNGGLYEVLLLADLARGRTFHIADDALIAFHIDAHDAKTVEGHARLLRLLRLFGLLTLLCLLWLLGLLRGLRIRSAGLASLHTLDELVHFGIRVDVKGRHIDVRLHAGVRAVDLDVPLDATDRVEGPADKTAFRGLGHIEGVLLDLDQLRFALKTVEQENTRIVRQVQSGGNLGKGGGFLGCAFIRDFFVELHRLGHGCGAGSPVFFVFVGGGPVDQRLGEFLPFLALGAEISNPVALHFVFGYKLVGAIFKDEPVGGLLRGAGNNENDRNGGDEEQDGERCRRKSGRGPHGSIVRLRRDEGRLASMMQIARRAVGIVPALAVFVLTVLLAGLSAAQAKPSSHSGIVDDGIVIEDVTLISPERPAPLPHAAVVIRDGRIAEIGTGLVAGPHATRIDGRGRFLIPGLIDSHVHAGSLAPLDDDSAAAHPELLQAFRSQLPRSFLAFGFTTLVDLNLSPDTPSWFNAAPLHPTLYHCGTGVRVIGGYPGQRIPKDAATANRLNIVYQAEQAKDWPANLDPHDYTPARAVDRVVEAGGICVKTFVETGFGGVFHWPVPSAETLAALRAETQRRGLVFIVHANAVESWRAALGAHADVIAHGLWHWPGDRAGTTPPADAREVIQAAARAGTWDQPTLQVVYGEGTVFDSSLLDDPRLSEALPHSLIAYLKGSEAQAARREMADEYRQAFTKIFGHPVDSATAMAIGPERATATLRLMLAENVKLLFGTDTPAGDGIGNPPGLNGRLELGNWAEAGVPLARILRAATLDNAVAFGLSDRGTVEVGKRADLLLLKADPLKTATAYDAIETIFLNGNPISRGSLLPSN
jgi:hypothetical protein